MIQPKRSGYRVLTLILPDGSRESYYQAMPGCEIVMVEPELEVEYNADESRGEQINM